MVFEYSTARLGSDSCGVALDIAEWRCHRFLVPSDSIEKHPANRSVRPELVFLYSGLSRPKQQPELLSTSTTLGLIEANFSEPDAAWKRATGSSRVKAQKALPVGA
jgi:hypothetical protein